MNGDDNSPTDGSDQRGDEATRSTRLLVELGKKLSRESKGWRADYGYDFNGAWELRDTGPVVDGTGPVVDNLGTPDGYKWLFVHLKDVKQWMEASPLKDSRDWEKLVREFPLEAITDEFDLRPQGRGLAYPFVAADHITRAWRPDEEWKALRYAELYKYVRSADETKLGQLRALRDGLRSSVQDLLHQLRELRRKQREVLLGWLTDVKRDAPQNQEIAVCAAAAWWRTCVLTPARSVNGGSTYDTMLRADAGVFSSQEPLTIFEQVVKDLSGISYDDQYGPVVGMQYYQRVILHVKVKIARLDARRLIAEEMIESVDAGRPLPEPPRTAQLNRLRGNEKGKQALDALTSVVLRHSGASGDPVCTCRFDLHASDVVNDDLESLHITALCKEVDKVVSGWGTGKSEKNSTAYQYLIEWCKKGKGPPWTTEVSVWVERAKDYARENGAKQST